MARAGTRHLSFPVLMKKTMDDKIAGAARGIQAGRIFIDENTRRRIRRLTDFKNGARLPYFRLPRLLPDGRILAHVNPPGARLLAVDPASGDVEQLPGDGWLLKFRERDGRAWFLRRPEAAGRRGQQSPGAGVELWQVDLPHGRPEFVGAIPPELPGHVEDLTCDGQYAIACQREENQEKYPVPITRDVRSLRRYFRRPRRGALWVYHLATGKIEKILETAGLCPSHLDASPKDPTLLRYCHDMPESCGQRIWTIRINGRERRPIRRQQPGELVTHEFWWADPDFIGYTYQDRRQDPTLAVHHWAEYALADTRLGIADLAGREVYLSDPLNSYHSHLYRSPDGKFVSGEGTDGNNFIYVARFSRRTTRLAMRALATIHTPYVPFRGQRVNGSFSADGRWMAYADQRDGADKPHQLFAVEVDL